jgi:hypothetical protein
MANEWKKKTAGEFNPMVNVKEKVGQITEGVYKGSKEIEKDGDVSVVHTIIIKGVEHDFWGTGQLNMLLSDVEASTNVRIVYNGLVDAQVKIKGKKVKKQVHNFDVFTK